MITSNHERESLARQGKKNYCNIRYENCCCGHVLPESLKYDKVKTESETLVGEYMQDLEKLAINNKLSSRQSIYDYFDSRKLPWKTDDLLVAWIEKELVRRNFIKYSRKDT